MLRYRFLRFTASVCLVAAFGLIQNGNPSVAYADLKSGKEALARGDFPNAFTQLRLSAEEGHPEAQTSLGTLYFSGTGVQQNYREALKWYERVSSQNDPDALKNMAEIYTHGLGGVRPDMKKAFGLYLNAANLGDAAAQFFVGHFFANGLGTPKNSVQALMWFDIVTEKRSVPLAEFQSMAAQAQLTATKLRAEMTREEIQKSILLKNQWKPKPR